MSQHPENRYRSGGAVPLSADQIRHHDVRHAGICRRGYRPHDVDLLMARIATEVGERDELIYRLRAEISDLREHYRAYYSDLGARTTPHGGPPDLSDHGNAVWDGHHAQPAPAGQRPVPPCPPPGPTDTATPSGRDRR